MNQLALFTSMPPQPPQPDPLKLREAAMEKALAHAGEKFRDAFTPFVVRYLERHGPSTAEQIRAAYEKTTFPKPPSKRASGPIYKKLRHEGIVREVGRENSSVYGNSLPVLELVK